MEFPWPFWVTCSKGQYLPGEKVFPNAQYELQPLSEKFDTIISLTPFQSVLAGCSYFLSAFISSLPN